MRLSYRRGLALPLHVGASGKPLLAHLPARTVADYLRFVARNQPAPGAGGRQALDRQLAEIRRTGVCVTVGELEPDSIGLGVPVFTDRRIAGCLSLAGHRSRFPSDRIRAVSKQLQRAGDAVERAWAVEPWDPEATETAGFRLPDTGRPVDEMRDGRPKSSPGKGDDLDAPAR